MKSIHNITNEINISLKSLIVFLFLIKGISKLFWPFVEWQNL